MAESEDFVEGQSASTKTGNFIDTNLTELEGLRAYTQETLENEVSRHLDDEISTREREREISNLKIEFALKIVCVKRMLMLGTWYA